MERRQEVQGSISKNAYNILLAEARDGLLKKESLKLIAMEKVDTNDPEHVLMYMLDVWWGRELHKGGVDGLSRLLEVLTADNVGLDALAEKIKSTKSKGNCMENFENMLHCFFQSLRLRSY